MGKRKRQNHTPANHAQPIPGTGLVPSPSYHKLDESREKRVKKVGQSLYRIIKRIVAPEANRFFLSQKDCHLRPKLISISNQQWIKSKRKFLLILVFSASASRSLQPMTRMYSVFPV
jgi:hypothetical protein